ncbi:MAG: hypothetical protein JJE04_06425 [Acidobacteriia bacterium]|nr:hypothetical protein [Terriglobia bacterium]
MNPAEIIVPEIQRQRSPVVPFEQQLDSQQDLLLGNVHLAQGPLVSFGKETLNDVVDKELEDLPVDMPARFRGLSMLPSLAGAA